MIGHDPEYMHPLDRTARLFLWLIIGGLVLAWLFSLTTDSFATLQEPPEAADEPVIIVERVVPSQTVVLPGGLTLRSFWANRLAEEREDAARRTLATSDGLGESSVGVAEPEQLRSEPQPDREPSVWTPADECKDIPNPGPVFLTSDVMRWCPTVANHLAKYNWQPGDLFRLLIYMECESNGIPTAVNPSSGTLGLYQFRPSSWESRSQRANHPGDWTDPHNNIGTALWLVKSGEPGSQPMHHAWNGCAAHDVVQQTFRNGGL